MNKTQWQEGVQEELYFWDYWFTNAGMEWPDDYKFRIDPDTELQQDLKNLVGDKYPLNILDVGAGPLTFLGKKINGRLISIIALDALADEYDKILDKHKIVPPIGTEKHDSEDLDSLPPWGFDLIVAQNTLDHSYDPVKAILSMPRLLRAGGVIWLKHYINEAERGKYNGLHQWNFYIENDCLMIGSRVQITNLTEYFKSIYEGFTHEYQLTDLNEVVYILKKVL